MSRDHPESPEADSLARARKVNAVCERHEAAWRDGLRPRIEDQLDRGPEGDPPELLGELIALEVELRRGLGERPTPEEYLRRFPDQGGAIALAFDPPTEGEGDETRLHLAPVAFRCAIQLILDPRSPAIAPGRLEALARRVDPPGPRERIDLG